MQVVKTSVTVNNSPVEDYANPDNHAPLTSKNDSWVKTFYINTNLTSLHLTALSVDLFHPMFQTTLCRNVMNVTVIPVMTGSNSYTPSRIFLQLLEYSCSSAPQLTFGESYSTHQTT